MKVACGVKYVPGINVRRRGAVPDFRISYVRMEIRMRPRFLFACSALLVALMGFGSSPASACGGYYGYGYGYGYGCRCPGYGYGTRTTGRPRLLRAPLLWPGLEIRPEGIRRIPPRRLAALVGLPRQA